MKVIRFIFLLITAPLTATLVVYFIDLMEPALRSILGIAQATEDYWVPDAIGFVFILFVFFFFHILFLCLAWLLSRLGYKRSNKNIIICLHSLIASVSAAFIFHAPETGDLFYQSFLIICLMVGIPIFVSELISEKVISEKTVQ